MNEIRAFSPTGMLGSGYPEASLVRAMAWKPHFIGCDSGSTDGGPYFLGTGTSMFSRQAIKRDMRLMLLAARQADIPLLIGSAGMGGGEPNLQWALEVLTEIAAEEDLLALPHSPSVLQRGLVYRFSLNHLVEPADPHEMFPIEMVKV